MEIVECHSGSAYADKPVAFSWEGERQVVVEILSQGRTPQSKWFRVKTTDGQVFQLTYREETGDWQINQF